MRELREAMRTDNPRSRHPWPSQAEMAARLPGNVQGAEWSRWETGRHLPESDTLVEIATLLQTTTADLRAGRSDERREAAAGDLDELSSGEGASPAAAGANLERKMDEMLERIAALGTTVEDQAARLDRQEKLLRSLQPGRAKKP